jgi:hypothetical protein
MEGWIKLHRKFLNWEWSDKSEMVSLFIYLLLKANHENQQWHNQVIMRGQVVIGRVSLAKSIGVSEQVIRTCLNRLKSTNEITIKSTNKYSIVTIVNYNNYQYIDEINNQQINQEPNQQLTTNKNDKNIYKEKEINKEKEKKSNNDEIADNDFQKFWEIYDKDIAKAQCYKKWLTLKPDEILQIKKHIKKYVKSTPDKQYRKNPLIYLNSKAWNDEVITKLPKYENKRQRTDENSEVKSLSEIFKKFTG